MNQKDIKQLIIINLIILITFLFYVEFSVGNIFYRINHLGIKCLNLNEHNCFEISLPMDPAAPVINITLL